MKKQLLLILITTLFINVNSFSQAKIKLGHIDTQELLKMMPGRDSAEAILTDFGKTLEKQMKDMQFEFENKYNDYVSNQAMMSQSVQQVKMKELQDMQTRIESFQTAAQKDIQAKEKELVQPIIDKAKKAIEETAKENGYTYIFDSSVGVLLYQESSDDIMNLVKKKLGLK